MPETALADLTIAGPAGGRRFVLITHEEEGNGRLFVHHLTRTVFQISRRPYNLPQSRPWLGDFDARNRQMLLSSIAAFVGRDRFASGSSETPLRDTPE
jgi:hypothetical protein